MLKAHVVVLVAAVFLSQVAGAEEACPLPFGARVQVDATMTEVEIDGEDYRVRGRDNRDDFGDLLDACDLDDADDAFERWRKARRLTNTFAGLIPTFFIPLVGLPTAATGVVGAPIAAVIAHDKREAFVDELEDALQAGRSNSLAESR